MISNNIIAFNASGLTNDSDPRLPTLRSNCVYNPSGANYVRLSAGPGDISADPLFVDMAAGDYHLTAASPCVNAGFDSAPDLPALDFDRQPRRNGLVDIGADEFWPAATTIAGAKRCAGCMPADIDGAVVSAAFVDFFYVEADDRTCGIRVDRPNHGLQVGMRVHVTGALQTSNDGEQFIEASAARRCDPPHDSGSVAPLALTNTSLGGGPFGLQSGVCGWKRTLGDDGRRHCVWGPIDGLNNIGLLVRTSGAFAWVDEHTFILDDGSGNPVKCIVADGVTLDPSWTYVCATGMSGCERFNDGLHPLLRVTKQEDITAY